jgi:hypothetical protein
VEAPDLVRGACPSGHAEMMRKKDVSALAAAKKQMLETETLNTSKAY